MQQKKNIIIKKNLFKINKNERERERENIL